MSLLDDIRARKRLNMPCWVTNPDNWASHTAQICEILKDPELPVFAIAQNMNHLELWKTIAARGGALAALLSGIYAVVTRSLKHRLADTTALLSQV
jgi:hypothetical protein